MVGWQFPSFLRHIHSADEIGVKDPDPAIPHLTHIIFVGGCETSRVPVSFFKYRSRSASRGTWGAELELEWLWDINPQNRGRCWGVTPPCNPWTGILGCFCISFCTSVILSLLLVICHFHFYSPVPSHLDTSHHIKRNHGFSSKSKIRACRPTTGFSVEGTSPTASTSKIQCRGHPALSRLSGH